MGAGWVHEIALWLTLALWGAVGYGLAVSPGPDAGGDGRSVASRMQYLGSSRKMVAFGSGVGIGMLGFFAAGGNLDVHGAMASGVVVVGTVVGMLACSRVGARLQKLREPTALVSAGVGIGFGLAGGGVLFVAVSNFLEFGRWYQDLVFWSTVSLWYSVGLGLAVSPSPGCAGPRGVARWRRSKEGKCDGESMP